MLNEWLISEIDKLDKPSGITIIAEKQTTQFEWGEDNGVKLSYSLEDIIEEYYIPESIMMRLFKLGSIENMITSHITLLCTTYTKRKINQVTPKIIEK